MRHIIDAIAAQGRGKDKELLHVTKGEIAGLDALARRHFGRELPRNPRTGLKEASLFQDWFGSDVGMALDVAAPVAVGFIPGVGIPAAAAMGAGLGAANQGLGKGGTTESALLGGVAGGIGAYGGANMASGLGTAATSTAPAGVATPTSTAGASLGSGTIAEAAPVMGNTSTAAAYGPTAGSDMAGMGGTNLFQGSTNATAPNVMPSAATNTFQPGTTPVQMGIAGAENPAVNISNTPLTSQATTTVDKPINWNYLTTKDALSPATQMATSAMMTAGIPGAATDTTPTVPGVNKTLPKAEVYYTPYGERRTRIAAAQGGLMGYGDYDGAEDGVGLRSYGFGGFVESIQPGGWWGDQTSELYGAVDKALPFMKDITPGGAVGQLQPGRRDWERKQTEEEQRKKSEQEAGIAAALKAQQQQEFTDKWTDRYSAPVNMAEGGYTGPRDGEAVSAIVRASQPKEENAFEHPAIRKIAGQNVTQADFDAWNSARQGPNAFEHPMIRRMAGQNVTQDDLTTWNNRQRGYAGGGITNIAAAKGRYLQGPGGGLDDEIPARIDGKQEARLASGEYVVSSDVVSALGGGSSEEGARQLHAMMDRVRKQAHGTKKQINRVNPKKALPA